MRLNLKAKLTHIPKSVKLAVLIVVVSKLLVLATGYIVTYFNNGSAPPFTIIENMFNRWDAPHYIDIAKNGYVNVGDQANFIVFFPLYPALIRLFTVNFDSISLSALVVANVSSLIAFMYLYKLAKLEFKEDVAVKAVLFLSVFPTAYFLSAPYTEGVFFALIIAGFYYARLGKWQFAGVLSFLAALTRLAGLLMLPVLLVEYIHQSGWKPKKPKLKVLWVFSALAGFLAYLGLNLQVTGEAFTFMAIEATHWSNRFDPWSGLTSAYSWAINANYPDNLTIGIAPIVFAISGLVMVGVAVWKRLRPSYIVYIFLSWGLAVSTSWWISVPRYIMAMFPMFILLGILAKRKVATIAITIVSAVGLCYFTLIFGLGWWAF